MRTRRVAPLVPLLLIACLGPKEAARRSTELESLLKDRREAMENCAPRLLAEAEVAIEATRYHSRQGRPMDASKAMARAEEAVRSAWQQSQETRCWKDQDGDGIPDRVDACPALAEDLDGFQDEDGCPDPDNDGDGVPDGKDECPLEAGTAAFRGCPPRDTDGDGIHDDADACPDQPGALVNRGCPYADRDGDGVEDAADQCPDVAGDPGNHGCPYQRIQVTEKRIELKEKVFFKTGKADILPVSFPLLEEIAQALRDHPAIRVRIEGHTDSVGNDRTNLRLSQARAESVRRFLISRGVEANRLVAVGRGEEAPLDDNSTEAGRAVNRRVEFHILPGSP